MAQKKLPSNGYYVINGKKMLWVALAAGVCDFAFGLLCGWILWSP